MEEHLRKRITTQRNFSNFKGFKKTLSSELIPDLMEGY